MCNEVFRINSSTAALSMVRGSAHCQPRARPRSLRRAGVIALAPPRCRQTRHRSRFAELSSPRSLRRACAGVAALAQPRSLRRDCATALASPRLLRRACVIALSQPRCRLTRHRSHFAALSSPLSLRRACATALASPRWRHRAVVTALAALAPPRSLRRQAGATALASHW